MDVIQMSANKVFNINVVTEDGQTQHEDYPHEIDPQNYPQLSPDRQNRNERHELHVSQTKVVRPLATRMTRNATMANKHHKSSNNSNMMVTKRLAGKRTVDKIHSQVMDRS